jgi:hypothetical protein
MLVTVQIATFFSALGFAAWILGTVFEFKGIAVIGGGIVLILGGFVTVDGMVVKTGVQTDNQLTTVNTSTNNTTAADVAVNNSSQQYQYEPLSELNAFRIGFVVMLLGAAQIFQSLSMEVD